MHIKYKLTEEDYFNFNMFHVKSSKLAVSKFKRQRFLVPLLLLIVSFVFADAFEISTTGMLITFLVIGILWVIFYPKVYFRYITQNTKKMVSGGRVGHLLGEHNMMLNKEGIVDSAPKGETKVKWSSIINFKEDNNYFYIYLSKVSAIIIPKRELKNVEEIGTYIKSKVKITEEVEINRFLQIMLRKNG